MRLQHNIASLHGIRDIMYHKAELGDIVIVSFGDRTLEELYHNRPSNRVIKVPKELAEATLVKLDALNSAADILDLRSPPGNRLEILKGKRLKGLYSIRVDSKWRIVFRWEDNNAHDVRLMDYH